MRITLIAVGKTSTPYIKEGIESFLARVNRYVPMSLEVIPDLKSTRGLTADEQKRREGELIIKALMPGDHVVLLDERGDVLTSVKFAREIERRMASGLKRLVYVIGGPYGFSPEVYARADGKLSLSAMTFTHEMVRLFFTEQVYRAMTILRGEPYHHE
ncbi:MAG: 23S rRNA (pseudouridine(1915)-N(3))-methyltransferase RlmH [Bacteroides sp.]|nr:23S rRNA (pseudouridine(1915)-N(3))-methyltransferase RlmH [Bacteroides sp.]MBD5378044.1 23S rRNA (pseudouridine(1915)-N(3))-methyltransferase RlmH [Bacteroides sp.]